MEKILCKADNVTKVYPTYDTLNECLVMAQERLPVQTFNELFWLTQVIKNTVLYESAYKSNAANAKTN